MIHRNESKTKTAFRFFSFLLVSQGISAVCLVGQGLMYEGPEDPAGDPAAVRAGIMDGNRITVHFKNSTEVSDWPRTPASSWNDGTDAVPILDGMAFMVSARVYVEDDSIPVTDPSDISYRSDLDTLFFCQTNYFTGMDMDPTGSFAWGLQPVFGYFNKDHDSPATSNRPETWPPDGWPARGTDLKWPMEWNGRFGRNAQYADLESYFVANDAQDQEYLGPEDNVKYSPRPGLLIGDIGQDVSVNKGNPWGGIGVRVEQRGFQWNNERARDMLFREYNIANISYYDLPEVIFGFWVDNGIGGDQSEDDLSWFDQREDLAYSWDMDGRGRQGMNTATVGTAFLEGPGLSWDGVDNDDDGLVDENQYNYAVQIVGPYMGISDMSKFLDYYGLTEIQLKEHWDADEDQDWRDGVDTNEDFRYQLNEFPGDDIGLDGIGPTEIMYYGPDSDGTECNHKPDVVEGYGCEPNFAMLDLDETDMIGLTSFHALPFPNGSNGTPWFRDDKAMWELLSDPEPTNVTGGFSTSVIVFGTGPFPLYRGRTERFSVAQLHSRDDLAGLNSEAHSAPDLFELKRSAVEIYKKNYRFEERQDYFSKVTVYPGDADNNGVVDEMDLLPIGYYYGGAVLPRDSASVTWFGYSVTARDSNGIFAAGQYADANGDGEINVRDVIAIAVNWENTHDHADAVSGPDPLNPQTVEKCRASFETLYQSLQGDSEPVRKMKKILRTILGIEGDIGFSLSQNYPNPFNPTTLIRFSLPQRQEVTIALFNILGEAVRVLVDEAPYGPGTHTVRVNAGSLNSGMYIYRITAGPWNGSRKMVIVK